MSEADRIAAQSLRCEEEECVGPAVLESHCNHRGRPKCTWCLAVRRLPPCVDSTVYTLCVLCPYAFLSR